MPYTKEETHLKAIQSWQRIFLRRDEKKTNPVLPHMWNDEWEYLHQDLLKAQYEEAKTKGLNTGIYRSHCHGCRRVFYTMVSGKKYCNYNPCGMKAHRLRQRVRRWQNRRDTICLACGKMFTPQRSDAKYCSSACRQKAYRSRKVSPQSGNLPQP